MVTGPLKVGMCLPNLSEGVRNPAPEGWLWLVLVVYSNGAIQPVGWEMISEVCRIFRCLCPIFLSGIVCFLNSLHYLHCNSLSSSMCNVTERKLRGNLSLCGIPVTFPHKVIAFKQQQQQQQRNLRTPQRMLKFTFYQSIFCL